MGGIEDVRSAMRDRNPLLRSDAEMWREEVPAEDTAPTWAPEQGEPAAWGRTQSEARQLLRSQMCPICGEGPWKSPLNHAAKRHGILKAELREACGLNSVESVVDPQLAERFSENGKAHGRDMRTLAQQPRRKYQMTTAGKTALTQNLQEWEEGHPDEAADARAKAGRIGAAKRWGAN